MVQVLGMRLGVVLHSNIFRIGFWFQLASRVPMEFHPQPPSESGSASERLVEVVAEQTNTDPVELPPLYDTIDPEALDALFATLADGCLEFQYAGQTVRLESDGGVHVTRGVDPTLDDQRKRPAPGSRRSSRT